MKKVTAIIPTFNEAHNIRNAIESVLWADEVIVVDSYSTDDTIMMTKDYPVSVVLHEYISPSAQKNWIIPQAKNEWIFILDADEVVSDPLKEEIQKVLSQDKIPESAFWISRQNYYMGKKVRFSGWQNDGVIRLFKRDHGRYDGKRVHEKLQVNGQVGKLSKPLLHYTYKDLHSMLGKVDRYSSWKAIDRAEKGNRSGLLSMMFKPAFSFFKNYFFRLGILDGKVGFIICAISSWSVFLRQLKIWRINQGENIEI
jgi:glycosyltransferase involved in cell wall biosynthesis